MREYRFRMWDTIEKLFMNGSRIIESRINDLNKNGRWIYQQWTGLKDKNDKEIFEGDVLKVPVDINQEVHGNYSIHEVIIKKGIIITSYLKSEKGQILPKGYTAGFLLDSYNFDNKTFLFNDNPSMDTNVEIIGNIYENPELLEDSDGGLLKCYESGII
jgi:uncharacterized phage protein (TIGR01671 family)